MSNGTDGTHSTGIGQNRDVVTAGRREANRIATTNVTNVLADLIDGLQHPRHVSNCSGPPLGEAWAFLARVVRTGPSGAADFTDQRYWVVPVFINGSGLVDILEFSDDIENHEVTRYEVENLSERPPKGLPSSGGTHGLAEGAWVYVYAQYDNAGEDSKLRYFTFTGGAVLPLGEFQYMTLQMVTQLVAGYDWARLHPPL